MQGYYCLAESAESAEIFVSFLVIFVSLNPCVIAVPYEWTLFLRFLLFLPPKGSLYESVALHWSVTLQCNLLFLRFPRFLRAKIILICENYSLLDTHQHFLCALCGSARGKNNPLNVKDRIVYFCGFRAFCET